MPSPLTQFPSELRRAFQFLQDDLGFEVVRESDQSYGYSIEYRRGERRVSLAYDYRDDDFYFLIIRGAETPYPDDKNDQDFLALDWLFQSFEPNLDWRELQPKDRQYDLALELNARLLKQYGAGVLRGETWIAPRPRRPPREDGPLAPPPERKVSRRLWLVVWPALLLISVLGQRMCGQGGS